MYSRVEDQLRRSSDSNGRVLSHGRNTKIFLFEGTKIQQSIKLGPLHVLSTPESLVLSVAGCSSRAGYVIPTSFSRLEWALRALRNGGVYSARLLPLAASCQKAGVLNLLTSLRQPHYPFLRKKGNALLEFSVWGNTQQRFQGMLRRSPASSRSMLSNGRSTRSALAGISSRSPGARVSS